MAESPLPNHILAANLSDVELGVVAALMFCERSDKPRMPEWVGLADELGTTKQRLYKIKMEMIDRRRLLKAPWGWRVNQEESVWVAEDNERASGLRKLLDRLAGRMEGINEHQVIRQDDGHSNGLPEVTRRDDGNPGELPPPGPPNGKPHAGANCLSVCEENQQTDGPSEMARQVDEAGRLAADHWGPGLVAWARKRVEDVAEPDAFLDAIVHAAASRDERERKGQEPVKHPDRWIDKVYADLERKLRGFEPIPPRPNIRPKFAPKAPDPLGDGHSSVGRERLASARPWFESRKVDGVVQWIAMNDAARAIPDPATYMREYRERAVRTFKLRRPPEAIDGGPPLARAN